jgi:hypothetical protein
MQINPMYKQQKQTKIFLMKMQKIGKLDQILKKIKFLT